MGTRNFYTENANYIYALMPDTSEENIKAYREDLIEVNELEEEDFSLNEEDIINRIYEDFSEYEIEDAQKNIYYDIKKEVEKIGVDIEELNEYDNNRNFEGKIFGRLNYIDGRTGQSFNINLICRSGYYEGVNFDYEFNFTNSMGYEIYRDGEVKKQLENKFEKILDIIEKFYKMYTDTYRSLGTMSNGESIYETVN